MSRISSGDWEMIVLGKEDRVGEGASEEKFRFSCSRIHFPLSDNILL